MNSSMTEAIQRLQQIFREHDVGTQEDLLYLLTKKKRKSLDTYIYAWFVSYQDTLVRALKELYGLNLCLGMDKKSKHYPNEASLATIVKKLVVLSNAPVILTPRFRHPGCRGELIPTSWYELVLEYWPFVSSGLLFVLPRGITRIVDENQLEGESFIIIRRENKFVEKYWFLLDERIPSLKIIDLSKKRLLTQMTELDPKQRDFSKRNVYIYLPHLSGVPIHTIMSLRSDHGDLFVRYNSTIETFFNKSSEVRNEGKLLDVMRQTDDELRDIETEFNKLSKSQVLQASGVAVKLTLGVLCAFLPGEMGKIAGLVAGGGAINDVLSYFRTEVDRESIVSRNPFYFPWMLYQRGPA